MARANAFILLKQFFLRRIEEIGKESLKKKRDYITLKAEHHDSASVWAGRIALEIFHFAAIGKYLAIQSKDVILLF